ncbi:MAG: hypothetical protein NC548_22925 [Lachnospiraceae bacterium]|nr:hypothetical protein [Lachnospiraceae bacterium]
MKKNITNVITFADYAKSSKTARQMLEVIDKYNKVLDGMKKSDQEYFTAANIGNLIDSGYRAGSVYARGLKKMDKIDEELIVGATNAVVTVATASGKKIDVEVPINIHLKAYSLK